MSGREKKKKRGSSEDQEFRREFLNTLYERKRELEEALEKLKVSQKEYDIISTAGNFIDELDGAQREISSHSIYSMIERKSQELKKIEALIERVQKDGKFGICEECGRRIRKERLMIMPEATLCVRCQSMLERQSKRRGIEEAEGLSVGVRSQMDWYEGEKAQDEDIVVRLTPIDQFSVSDISEGEEEDPELSKD